MTQSTNVLHLEAGTHWICACGASTNSPYCDGSHKGTGLQPIALELEAPATVEISGTVKVQTSQAR